MREYDKDSRRKGKLIAQAYKLKDTLTQMYIATDVESKSKSMILAALEVFVPLSQ